MKSYAAGGGSKARPLGPLSPEAKVLLIPAGVNLKIVLLPASPSKRLPELSKARPKGPFSPEAKVLSVPSGVNVKIVLLPLSAAKRSPEAAWTEMNSRGVARPATVTSR